MHVAITGANRGLGLAFTRYYLDQGCDVWACFRAAPGALSDLAGPRLHLVPWDVTEDKTQAFVEEAGFPANLDLLINNAGIYGAQKEPDQTLEGITAETMHQVFDVNCVGTLRVTKLLWSRVARAEGVIANVSSKMGSARDNTSGGCYAYRAGKAAQVSVSRSLAWDLAPHGVRVITLHPGWVSTDMTRHSGLIDPAESVAGMAEVIRRVDEYDPGAFVAYDGTLVPY